MPRCRSRGRRVAICTHIRAFVVPLANGAILDPFGIVESRSIALTDVKAGGVVFQFDPTWHRHFRAGWLTAATPYLNTSLLQLTYT
jgi:hypothetical protein